MYYLIYMSTASRPMTYEELSDLLKEARAENVRRGITGMLLHQHDTFMQILEGEEQDVQALYEKLRKDPRHNGLHIVRQGKSDRRLFADWSMGFVNMDRAGEYPEYDQYIDKQLTLDTFRQGGPDVLKYLICFNQLSQE